MHLHSFPIVISVDLKLTDIFHIRLLYSPDKSNSNFELFVMFFRDNPAQIHRLMPWISRDLQCLLRQSQHDVNTVLESINTALSLMNILSPAFRRRLQSYLGNKTAHFIHELNNFARSPYDMIGYDRVVEYSPQSSEDLVIEFTSSDDSTDNDEINVADDSASMAVVMPNAASTNGGIIDYDDDYVPGYHRVLNAHLNSFTAINLTIHNRLTTNTGRGGETATSSGTGTMRSGGVQDGGVSLVIDLRGEPEEPSTSDDVARLNDADGNNQAQPTVTVAENIELTSGSSDECEFVLERKPPHLRTPEMVSLDSASDSDVVFVEESKPLNKATFSTSEDEPNEDAAAAEKPKRSTRSKITALVESKKRNQQSSNSVKNESQENAHEMYNVGASTSAALRLSIQQRSDRSRVRRTKYSLRNTRSETDQSKPRRRGKRLPSESSHSSNSSASNSSSVASNSASDSTSDEEFLANIAQKRNSNQRKRRRTKKTRKSRCNSTTKSDSRKRRKPNNNDTTFDEDEDDDDDDDDEENGHMGKNFALVMAVSERLKRQKEKLKRSQAANAPNEKDYEEDENGDHSDGENSWRLKAVNEPLRKQQEKQVKSALASNERKRKIRKSSQNLSENAKHPKMEPCVSTKLETPDDADESVTYNNCGTSSDESESDNLKLIELKTKLTRKNSNSSSHEDINTNPIQANEEEDAEINSGICQNEDRNEIVTSSSNGATTCSEGIQKTVETPTAPTDTNGHNMTTIMPTIQTTEDDVHSSTTDDENSGGDDHLVATCIATDLKGGEHNNSFKSENPSNDHQDGDDQMEDEYKQIEKLEDIEDHNHDDYSNDTTNISSPMQAGVQDDEEDDDDRHLVDREEGENDEEDDDDEGSEETLNIPTSMNLSHESNVFDGGASMSTTTTDTILNDAAEQISSAAVSFYNPQSQSFNTADFDENTSNSSSSESSVSSTTTSSSSSSSSNFMNYELS